MKIVTSEQMADLDAKAINNHGIPSEQLMERAGKGIFEYTSEIIRDCRLTPYVVLFAGRGNNGGDAFVVARYLEKVGTKTTTIILTDENSLTGDAMLNYTRLKDLGAGIVFIKDTSELQTLNPRMKDCGVVVDGILGTGLKGEVTGFFADVINFINSFNKTVVAIDIPSGINGTDGFLSGACIKADATITMGLPKQGFFLGESLNYIGKLRIADIGIPNEEVEKVKSPARLITQDSVRDLFPKRKRISHKGDYGRVMALCGSRGYTGAACLVTQAAMRCGTGLSYLLIPENCHPSMEAKLTEVITIPIPETDEGTPAYSAFNIAINNINSADAAAIGPGLSTNSETARLVRHVVKEVSVPLVLDADGLNAINEGPALLNNYRGPLIITPHIGEFARLVRTSPEDILDDIWGRARKYAKDHGIVVVLKGAQTVIATPDGELYINIMGNSGMASAGMGDVLTGIIASLLGQGLNAVDAARFGVFLHGTAGDLAANVIGEPSLIASDVIDTLPLAISSLANKK